MGSVLVCMLLTAAFVGIVADIGGQGGSLTQGPWNVHFEEVAVEVGLGFRHAGEVHDPEGEDLDWPAFPEIMGAGACWADFTGDGYDDLYVTNQRYNENNPYAEGLNARYDPVNAYYVNNGNGTFTHRTVAAGLESRSFDQGCSAADYDGDGRTDLFVAGFGPVTLFSNQGDGTFTDVTQPAGVDRSTACLPEECWHTCSAWVDYDRDGWLDLFVCTYVESGLDDTGAGPGGRTAQYNWLFRNNGDGTFDEVGEEAGVEGVATDVGGSKSLGAVWFDADVDGWPDLYVTNDMTPNEFYWNNGDGMFTRDDEAGLYDGRAGMGVTAGDVERDGDPDLYFTHYQRQQNGYYLNNGDGTFRDRSGIEGLAYDWEYVGWGTRFVDLDRDGHLDLYAGNGHTAWPADQSDFYGQQTLVFQQKPQGDGSTVWVNRTHESGPGVLENRVTRGAASADFDLDGDVDVVLANNANQTLQFLRASGVENHWLYVQPVQEGANPRAVGARVVVETADQAVQTQEVRAGSSYLSQDSLLADFGLGAHAQADRVTVHWPDGGTTVVEGVPADRVARVVRETGEVVTDTLSPVTTPNYEGDHLSEGWYRDAVEAVLEAKDRAVGPASGVESTEYRINGGSWILYEGETIVFPEEEGRHEFDFRSVDRAGNVEPLNRDVLGIDFTPPQTDHQIDGTPLFDGWWEEAQVVLEVEDPLSGVRRVEIRVDGGGWNEYTDPVPLGEGEHFVEYRATDRADNVAPVRDVWVRVDATPPEVGLLKPVEGRLYAGNETVTQTGVGPAVVLTLPQVEGVPAALFIVEGFAGDETSGLQRVDLFLGGKRVATLWGEGPQEWAWDTTQFSSGGWVLDAVAQDVAGHVAVDTVYVVLAGATQGSLLETLEEGPATGPWGGGLP